MRQGGQWLRLPYRITGKFHGEGSRMVTLTAMKQGVPVALSRSLDSTSGTARDGRFPKSNKAAIIAVSEEHQVLSAYTAFLASQTQAVAPGGLSGGMAERLR